MDRQLSINHPAAVIIINEEIAVSRVPRCRSEAKHVVRAVRVGGDAGGLSHQPAGRLAVGGDAHPAPRNASTQHSIRRRHK